MPEGFGINYDVVLRLGEELGRENTRLNGTVDRMEETARSRFAEWQAEGQQAYVVASGTWKDQAEIMANHMQQSIQRLHERVHNYQYRDRQSAQGI